LVFTATTRSCIVEGGIGMVTDAAHDAIDDAAHNATRTASLESDARPRPVPDRVGRYEICDVLGSGAMGVVYRARDPELDRALAIKLVRTDGESRSRGARLMREAQAMARLRHPNVVPIFDVGPADEAVFVAMPLLEAGTLRSWLRAEPRTLDEILDRFVAAGRGLAAAHAAGLIHRDFKPDNVLLGNGGEVQVADFGLARLADRAIATGSMSGSSPGGGPGGSSTESVAPRPVTQTGAVVGTPAYMAPEQLRGRASDERADQFSFCLAMWEAVFDERPFGKAARSADPLRARIDAISAGPLPPRRVRPAWIAPLLARGMALDPARRWPTMQALLDAIVAHRAPRRWPWRVAAAVGAIALAVGAAAVAWPGRQGQAQYHLEQLTHRSDLKVPAISPDGGSLAVVTGDSLVVRRSRGDDRILIEHGVDDVPLAWSPDGKRLIAALAPEVAGLINGIVVDVETGARAALPAPGMAAFLSEREVAVIAFRQRSVAIYPTPVIDRREAVSQAAAPAPTAVCEVPGDYVFLWRIIGFPDGTMVIETIKGASHALIVIDRECKIRSRLRAVPFSSVAASDAGTLVAMIVHDGFGEILELAIDGTELSRRVVSGDLERAIGRRAGVDYVSTLAPRTHLDRVRDGRPPLRQFSISGNASFSLAPDGETLAWIERNDHSRAPGQLRLSTLATMARPHALLDGAVAVSWSPDGNSLAVLIDGDAGVAAAAVAGDPARRSAPDISLLVVDRTGAVLRRVPLRGLESEAAPVWLDGHRIAAQTDDRTTYRWYDLSTGEQGELVDRRHGSTYWLARSPRDGTLAMWRNGAPGGNDATTEHLWLMPAGGEPRPLHLDEASRHFLVPSWTASGELLVRALDTGTVFRVDLSAGRDTGEITAIAQLPPIPLSRVFDDHLMTLADGDLLAVERELGINVAAVRPDDEPRARPREPVRTPL
jgi:hypothetical protein